MNIFFIDKCPIKSAQQLCDKHVVKMVLETAQMCSTAMRHWDLDEDLKYIYKSAYINHPMTVWVRANIHNLSWAVWHGISIGTEYTYRFGKIHKSSKVLEEIRDRLVEFKTPDTEQYCLYLSYNLHDEPPQCMPDEFKCDDYVEAYRAYYRKGKAHILNWTFREQPDWI